MITQEYYTGTHAYHSKINWPWFHFKKSRHVYSLEGVRIPRRFGRAYIEYDTDVDVFYIIPINLIVAFWRAAMLRIKWRWPEKLAAYEKKVAMCVIEQNRRSAQKEYKAGYDQGWRDGRFLAESFGETNK